MLAAVRSVMLIFVFLMLRAEASGAIGQPELLVRVWQSQDGLPGNAVRSIVEASDGYLWVATAEGVARFNGFEFEPVGPAGDPPRSRLAFFRLFAGSGGTVWAATQQGGLFRAEKGRLNRILENIREPAPPLVTQLLQNPDGTVLIKRGSEFKQISPGDEISEIPASPELSNRFGKDLEDQLAGGRIRDPDGNMALRDRLRQVWTSGNSRGLTVTAPGLEALPVDLPQIGQSYAISEMLEDREGNVWLACPVNGLVRVRRTRVEMLDVNQGRNERAVIALMEDRSGVWWIANRSGGIYQWTPAASRFIELAKTSHPRPAAALFEDRDSRLWAASRDGTVFRFDQGSFTPQFIETQVPSKVRSITQDAQGILWFGGSQGLASYAGGIVRRFGRADGVDELDLTAIQPYAGGRIIAGSTTGTVLLGGAEGFQTIATPEILNRQWVSGILPLSAGETWVTTLGGGLYMWNGNKWSCFDASDGLPDSRLTCILDDGKGCLWMGSLGGVIRAERRKLLAHLANPETAVQWLRLDHTDGLQSRECIGGFQPAGWRAKDGLLWFPTGNGIARIRPDLIAANEVAPPVYLQTVRTNGMLHPGESGPLHTDPGRARLEFHFVGLSLSAPEKITYRSRLAGLDDAWRELGTQRVATFEAVPPGRYVSEVVAVNGDGLRSATPASIVVVVKPHFWETVWFFVFVGGLVLAVAAGVGWLAARMRMKTRFQELKVRHAREAERARIARDLHDDLGANLTEISILAALAAEDAAATQLHTPLNQLSVKAKQVVGSLDEIVWAVNPREDTLRSLVDYLAAFAREFLDIANIPLRLDVAREIPDHPLDAFRRHGTFLAAREALNNIVKHSGATSVTLRIALADHLLEIRIEDDGCGFEPAAAAGGNGLDNLKQRMWDAGGDCRIETRRGRGTTVFLTLSLLAGVKSVT